MDTHSRGDGPQKFGVYDQTKTSTSDSTSSTNTGLNTGAASPGSMARPDSPSGGLSKYIIPLAIVLLLVLVLGIAMA
ncbi:MAG TPA: hypothetical protein VEY95_13700 [Azospirillaceae bacterium]|nr:hypothetical protein [Azospirillaceae bacterium]